MTKSQKPRKAVTREQREKMSESHRSLWRQKDYREKTIRSIRDGMAKRKGKALQDNPTQNSETAVD